MNYSYIGKLNITEANVSAVSDVVPFSPAAATVFTVIVIWLLILGTIGNLLTIVVISKSQKLKSVFNEFILSLCFSDLLSAFISWISLYRKTTGFLVFSLPNTFCVIYWGAEMWTSYVTSLHILSFAILRLISIWRPMLFFKIKIWHAKVWAVTIWIIAFVCGFIPMALFSGARVRDRTQDSPVHKWPACSQNIEWFQQYSIYTRYCYPIFFYIPTIGILFVSGAIGIALGSTRRAMEFTARQASTLKNRRRKEHQAIMQLSLIVGSFMLGYIPFTAYEFYSINTTDNTFEGWRTDWMFGSVVYICLRFSETLNPVFYNLASSKMRRHTIALLRQMKEFVLKFLCCGVQTVASTGPRPSSCSTSGNGGLEV